MSHILESRQMALDTFAQSELCTPKNTMSERISMAPVSHLLIYRRELRPSLILEKRGFNKTW